MCRLYSLNATHPTRISCELIEAQNSLIRQAEQDARGHSNPHGWGIGWYADGAVRRERQVQPAASDQEFRRRASEVQARLALAHIRRATVGEPAIENTHPFVHRDSMLAHNGHIPAFDRVGPRMRQAIAPQYRDAIAGSTDSEHCLYLLLTHRDDHPDQSLSDVICRTVDHIQQLCQEASADEEPALNLLWSVGDRLAGVRSGRTLWWVDTDHTRRCPTCGRRHAQPAGGQTYRAIELASERITDEDWKAAPKQSAFEVSPQMSISFQAV